MIHGRPNSGATVRSIRQMLLAASGITVPVIFSLGIVFLIWVHRVNANARAMGAEGLHFGPRFSVAVFFVPPFSTFPAGAVDDG